MGDKEDVAHENPLIPNQGEEQVINQDKVQQNENNKEEEGEAKENESESSEDKMDFNNRISEVESKSEKETTLNKFIGENTITLMTQSNEELERKFKPLMNRMFDPMKDGSLRGSIFAISSLALGTGCLALPIRFTQLGLVWGLIFLIASSIIAYWSLTIMVQAAEKQNAYDYSRFVKQTLGNTPALILDLVIIFYIFGVLISYQVIIFSIIGRVYYDFSPGLKLIYNDFTLFEEKEWNTAIYQYPIMYGVAILLIPLCLLKDISKMRFTSLFSICSLFYVIGVIVVESPFFFIDYLKNKPESEVGPNWIDLSQAFGQKLNFFPCLATMFFSFTCHVGAFPVYKTLKDNSLTRINKVFLRSIILDVVIYIFVGISGFLTAPTLAPSLIIYRKPIFDNDIFMTIAKIGIAVNLICSTPANYNAFRLSFFETILKKEEIPNSLNLAVTIPTLLIVATIGALFNKIIAYISILGGFCSVTISFLFPILLYVKSSEKPLSSGYNLLMLIFAGILCAIGWTSGILTILFEIVGYKPNK